MNDHDKSTNGNCHCRRGNGRQRAGAGYGATGFTVMVIEHAAPAPFVADSQPDVRIFGRSAASVALLRGWAFGEAVQDA